MFSEYWYWLLKQIMTEGIDETNQRTKAVVRTVPGAVFFKLNLQDGYLPVPGLRKIWPRVAAAETAWQILGHNHLAWLKQHTAMWNDFATEKACHFCINGVEMFNDIFETCKICDGSGKILHLEFAYGHRWRHAFDRDQLWMACDALRANRSDRRIWISSWHPGVDGLGTAHQKNVPCPVGFGMSITEGTLHMAVTIRSSDVFVGLPYDVMNYAMLMAIMATETHARLGTLSFTLNNAHLYEVHHCMVKEAMDQEPVESQIPLLWRAMREIVDNPNYFVKQYADAAARAQWPTFAPKPAVVL